MCRHRGRELLSFSADIESAVGRYRKRQDQERWDQAGHERCPESDAEQPQTGAYGMFNWGDWNFPGYHDDIKGCDAWGNLEYDTTQVFALAQISDPKADYWDDLTAAARHFMDVDRIHKLPQHPAWNGMNHPKNPKHFTFRLGGVDLGHTWTEGLLAYYLLTGEDRSLAAAKGIGGYLLRRIDGGVQRANPRQWGWPQIALIALYDITADKRYLRGARRYAKRGMEAHPSTSKLHWKHGILADALAYVHSVTDDPEIWKWLEGYAASVARHKKKDLRFYSAIAYVGRVSGTEKYSTLAQEKFRKMRIGNWGKPLTIAGRYGFRILSQRVK